MKRHVLSARSRLTAGLWVILLTCTGLVRAQPEAIIEASFANPVYHPIDRIYSVDVMLQSRNVTETLFGINLRFYYDASYLEFAGLDQYAPGYGHLHEPPKSYTGSEVSGVQIFSFNRAAGYVNGGIQLIDDRFPFEVSTQEARKIFRANFHVPLAWQEEASFCPSLVWDLKPFTQGGGLLPGGDGLVITVVEKDRSARTETEPSIAKGQPFNWQYRRLEGMPYGQPIPNACISLAQTTSIDESAPSAVDGYALFQNQPNPFDAQTSIEFVVPHAQQVALNFYSVQGELLEVIPGYYEAGRNKVMLQRKPWMDRNAVVYYQLTAGDGVTLLRKMNVIGR